jgi:hypothetical protein
MELTELIYVMSLAVLIVIWWVGIWGLTESLVRYVSRRLRVGDLIIHTFMVSVVTFIIFLNTSFTKHFT